MRAFPVYKNNFTEPENCGVFCDPVLEPLLVELGMALERYGLVLQVGQLSHDVSLRFRGLVRSPPVGFPRTGGDPSENTRQLKITSVDTLPRVNRNFPAVDTTVHDEPIPRKAPLCPKLVAALTGKARVLDYYGGVTAALKRAIRRQPLAEADNRSVGMPIGVSATMESTSSLGIKG